MKRLSVFLVVVSVSLLAWNIYDYLSVSNEFSKDPETRGLNALKRVRINIDSTVLLVSEATGNLIGEIEASALMEEDLPYLISQQVSQHSEIKSVKVAFEPYQFDSDREQFGLNYEPKEDTFSLSEINYDYRDDAEILAQWYTIPIEQNSSTISVLYGEREELMLMDYSAPIFWREGAGGQQFIGAVNVRFSLDHSIAPSSNQNGLLADQLYFADSQAGSIIYTSHQLSDSTLLGLFKLSDEQIFHIAQNERGSVDLMKCSDESSSILLYETSEQTGWKIITKISSSDETDTAEMVEKKLTNVYYSGSLFLVLVLLFMYSYFHRSEG